MNKRLYAITSLYNESKVENTYNTLFIYECDTPFIDLSSQVSNYLVLQGHLEQLIYK